MTSRIAHASLDERRARGMEARSRVPINGHEGWQPAGDRPDPVALLEAQNVTREPDLVPVRHGRMMVSPFTFYRGAAKIMATDLKDTPTAGLTVQLCGDAHLSNFGGFASPERQLLFDLNDFDETFPGPFEYDVKRMAASFTIAARNNAFSKVDVRGASRASVAAYRQAMLQFAQMGILDIWYARLNEADVLAAARSTAKDKKALKDVKRGQRNLEKAHTRDSLQALSKLAEYVDGRYRIISQPPVLIPLRDLVGDGEYGIAPEEIDQVLHDMFREYRATLQPDRRHLLEQFQIIEAARKVVGVGSVGTRAYILLLQGRDQSDPLFLQIKEATASVLEDHLPKGHHQQPGERVVHGQRMMQASSDIFLGWVKGLREDRFFYVRQLRDMKVSALVEEMSPIALNFYAGLCGWTLARAHARSGDPVAIAEYLGQTDAFDTAMVDFSDRYAKQNERDFKAFTDAVSAGRIEAKEGV